MIKIRRLHHSAIAALLFSVALIMLSCNSNDYADAYDATASTGALAEQPKSSAVPSQPAHVNEPEQPTVQPAADVADVQDADFDKAYDLGFRAASRMLSRCRTDNEIRNELLDLRAREYAIRTQVGSGAADAYINGIRTCIEQQSDTLAEVLF